MKKTKKAFALVLAGAFVCGLFAGCDLVTTDSHKNLAQVIAEVNITSSEDFAEGGKYEAYKGVIKTAEILKRDMVATYVNSGYSLQSTYGWSYADTFEFICNNLVNRQIALQYATVYFLENDKEQYPLDGYKTASTSEIAAVQYFLDQEEIDKAYYSARKLFNNSLDSQEKTYIETDDDNSSSEAARTLPKGLNTDDEDYYDTAYRIYTGNNAAASCGSYETVEGSTPTTRKKAYNQFLANLRRNDLLQDGEKTNEIEELNYFQIELKSYYESALITKFSDCIEAEAEQVLTPEYMQEYYQKLFDSQSVNDKSSFESSLDSISDSNFILTAPEENYGYVINILLPFSAAQSAVVGELKGDYKDEKGNNFAQRASILKMLTATDQRGSWFNGTEDYSYEAEGYTGGDENRGYLFFEDNLVNKDGKYEPLKNYYGKYTYNGSAVYSEDKEKYILSPNKIDIDGFISEMEGYLASAEFTCTDVKDNRSGYYTQSNSDYYGMDGKVKYENFIYYAGQVNEVKDGFNANELFVAGSDENKAFSIINELSFAYNTDTAGLNGYLGYSVVVGKTSFVDEFEFAAQYACEQGAGTYVIAPSNYGWHIIYCTFSFKKDGGKIEPFAYNHADKDKEGTFSNLFYESVKAKVVESYSNQYQNKIIDAYSDCKTVYEDRYADLTKLGS